MTDSTEKRLAEIRARVDTWLSFQAQDDARWLLSRIEQMQAALEWYAGMNCVGWNDGKHFKLDDNCGDKARAALDAAGGGRGET